MLFLATNLFSMLPLALLLALPQSLCLEFKSPSMMMLFAVLYVLRRLLMLYLLAGLLHIVIIIMLLYVSLIAAVSNSVSGRRTFAYGIPRLFICFQKFRFRHG